MNLIRITVLAALCCLIPSIFSCSTKTAEKTVYTEEELIGMNDSAYALMMAGDYESALVLLDQLIDLKDDYPGAFANRGTIYCDMGDYEQCLENFMRVQELDPSTGMEIPLLIGALHDRTGKTEVAKEYYSDIRSGLEEELTTINTEEEPTGPEFAAIMNLIFVEVLSGDQAATDHQIERLESRFPGHPMVEGISEFNKETLLSEWFPDQEM